MIAALADPVAYCVQTVSVEHSGPIIVAGPSKNGGLPQFAGGGPPPGRGKPSEQVSQKLAANGDDYTWVAAATGSIEASGYQLAMGKSMMPIGGFAGADPAPTLQQFQGYVEGGRVHYYLESSRRGMPFFDRESGAKSESAQIRDWVKQQYTAMSIDGVTLYDLTSVARYQQFLNTCFV